jgi:hypothetical protein
MMQQNGKTSNIMCYGEHWPQTNQCARRTGYLNTSIHLHKNVRRFYIIPTCEYITCTIIRLFNKKLFHTNSLARRMPSPGMWRRVDLVWTDVSVERIASILRVDKSESEEPAWTGGLDDWIYCPFLDNYNKLQELTVNDCLRLTPFITGLRVSSLPLSLSWFWFTNRSVLLRMTYECRVRTHDAHDCLVLVCTTLYMVSDLRGEYYFLVRTRGNICCFRWHGKRVPGSHIF